MWNQRLMCVYWRFVRYSSFSAWKDMYGWRICSAIRSNLAQKLQSERATAKQSDNILKYKINWKNSWNRAICNALFYAELLFNMTSFSLKHFVYTIVMCSLEIASPPRFALRNNKHLVIWEYIVVEIESAKWTHKLHPFFMEWRYLIRFVCVQSNVELTQILNLNDRLQNPFF